MIKEYIDKLYDENQKELNNLEKQMSGLVDELNYTQKWEESLQTENNSQTSIFSPRIYDQKIEQNLEEVQNKIERINQQLEYTREMIETHLKKKNEYQTLKAELESSESNSDITSGEDNYNKNIETKQIKDLLNDIYNRCEISLACLNSNKNRSKSELSKIKRIIHDYISQID